MNHANLYEKDAAIKRAEYVKELNYTDKEYKKNIRKRMFKYKDNAKGLYNTRLTAEQELVMYESHGLDNLKWYALDILSQNIEYCEVLECKTPKEQVAKAIEFLRDSCDEDYLKHLGEFSTKNGNTWYVPVDRMINWIDCYMIQREVFFKYANGEDSLLYAPHYFTNNILLMLVFTDNEEEDFENDLDEVMNVYSTLVEGIAEILEDMPKDREIDDLFHIDDRKLKKNAKEINKLAQDYLDFIGQQVDDEEDLEIDG